jgi:hypothetical protein
MKTGSRPQYYRIRRMVQMVREGTETGSLPNSSDFMNEFEVSRRTVARDLDFLRDEERAPLAYDDARHGFRLTDETYMLPPVRISRKEAFSFGLARKLLAHYEGTPLHLDMRSVLDKIAESLEGEITIEPDWLSEHVGVLPEDRVRIDPEVWAQLAGFVERREPIRATYQTFDGRVSEYELHPYHLIAYHGNSFHPLTLRLTKLLLNQNLNLGLFLYWSPSDHDAFLRPKASYKLDDHWIVELGGNIFVGADDYTFFGQFERNNNLYASVRYGF